MESQAESGFSLSAADSSPMLRTAGSLQAHLLSVSAGIFDLPAAESHLVDINVGTPARVLARRDGRVHQGIHNAGDVDIVPAGTASHWEAEMDSAQAQILLLYLPPAFLRDIAARSGFSPDRVELVNRFQAHDPQITHIGLALKAEMQAAYSSGPLYNESLSTALAMRLLTAHNAFRLMPPPAPRGGLAPPDLRRVLDYIHDRLDASLSLAEIARTVHLSPSHFTRLFRRSIGLAPHQYVIAQRVEAAANLLRGGEFSVGEVATRVGFASQSHLHRHYKRRFGAAPATHQKGANVQNGGTNVEADDTPVLL